MFTDVLDDIELQDVDYTDLYNSVYKSRFGDVLIYNNEYNSFNVQHIDDTGLEDRTNAIGIVVKEFTEQNYYDIILRNYLTANGIIVPWSYNDKQRFIPTYLMDLFKRYSSKFIRESKLDISNIKFMVPEIAMLDYIDQNITAFRDSFTNIWGEERSDYFFERFYNNGIFSIHKNKYYQWKPEYGKKRTIHNLTHGKSYEFLPAFRVSIDEAYMKQE